ncbi:090e1e70-ab4f-49fd-9a42-a50519227366 [Thermothielavioides terrestris]|uniref:090e1e70-ab4f-49fd-9a42-a50519227366 n=1 Tax=Thermothielavioides terrestris TaxID=2587410 RepID=A0A446BYA3_9PEZI|nr:090e1e70-ab4f-49fd-9a42-a50519227366 [Thermothielavioides terrestris]
MSLLARPRAPPSVATLRASRGRVRGRVRLRHPAFGYSTSSSLLSSPRRTNDFTSGYTSTYDPNQETGRGPIFDKHTFGVPQFYPRDLKRRVDDYVVGQERAKKIICSVIFNHYQGLRRRQHHELQDQRLREKLQRQQFAQNQQALYERAPRDLPRETEGPDSPADFRADDFYIPEDASTPEHVKIDKSNLLLIGPTGVGKTYILETLSKKLNVPFTISDCNSFTQAGYIGQDVESCIERLLIEANYDTKAAQNGIVVLDEFDKIAKRDTTNGRDVGGEGVQQALLKLVEGTKVTINIKDNRSSRTTPNNPPGGYGPTTPPSAPPSGKVDQYIIDTSNILFVFSGAFVGLEKVVLRRVAKPSIGFGSEVRGRDFSLSSGKDILPPEMYNHLPHQPAFPGGSTGGGFTPLDLTTPADLQAYGFIPELIGRLHNICALTPLSLDELYRILTEPRNSLVAQYTALFETYPSKLFFTRRALYAIAQRAAKNETGARGLKMEMERVLAEPMFDAPMPYVLITEACVNGTEKACYWGKDGKLELERRILEEDGDPNAGEQADVTLEQFREAGLSGA